MMALQRSFWGVESRGCRSSRIVEFGGVVSASGNILYGYLGRLGTELMKSPYVSVMC